MPPFKISYRLTPQQRAFQSQVQRLMMEAARQKHRRDMLVARLNRRLRNMEMLERQLGKSSGAVGLGWRKKESGYKGVA